MAQTFISGQENSVVRPGVYFRKEKVGTELAGSTQGVVAAVYSGDWGSLNKVVELDPTMINSLDDYVGNASDFIKEAFIGGATKVLAVRAGAEDGECSSIELLDTKNRTCLKITSNFPGERIFYLTLRQNLITEDKQLLILDEDANLFQSFDFSAQGNQSQNLKAAMLGNRFFSVELYKGDEDLGEELKPVAQMAMTPGVNPTVTVKSYSNALNCLERYKWNCAVVDTNNTSVIALLTSFVRMSYETGTLGFGVIGGLRSQSLDQRMTSAAGTNDEKIVYLLNGWRDIYGKEYEGYLAAARLAGMIAGSASNVAITHDVIQDAAELLEPLTNGEIARAEKRGCLVLSLNDDYQCWCDNAITTLVTLDATQDAGWKKIRRTKTRFELISRCNATLDKLVGNVNNDADGQATILAACQGIINEMCAEHKLISGSYVELDPNHKPEADMVWLKYHIGDIDSAEKIFETFVFSWGNPFAVAA